VFFEGFPAFWFGEPKLGRSIVLCVDGRFSSTPHLTGW
jgi:hypothetical protein